MLNDKLLDEEQITIVDEDGNEVLFDIVLTFELEKFEKSYVVVTPITEEEEDEEEETVLFVFAYTPDESGEEGSLDQVEDEEEWTACEEVINSFMDIEELDEVEEEK